MSKKNDEKEEVKFDENRPTLETNVATNDAVLAHNWQPNSPAVDLRYSGAENAVNTVAVAAALEEVTEEKKIAKTVSEAEMDRRSKLDVSHPDYLNPSLGHVKVK